MFNGRDQKRLVLADEPFSVVLELRMCPYIWVLLLRMALVIVSELMVSLTLVRAE